MNKKKFLIEAVEMDHEACKALNFIESGKD
jgi:hypothetical protein